MSIVFEAPSLNRKASCSCLKLQLNRQRCEWCHGVLFTYCHFWNWGWGSGRGSRTSSEHKCIHLAPKQWWPVPWISMRTSLVLTRLAKLAFCVFVLASQLTDHDSSNRGNWRVAARRSRKSGQCLKDIMLMLLHCEKTHFVWFWWKVLWGWLLRCLASLVGVTVTTALLGTQSVWLGHWRLDAKHVLKWSSLWFQNVSKCWTQKYHRFKLRIFPLSKLQSSCCCPRTASVMSKLSTCWSLQSLTLQWSKKISCQGKQIVIFRHLVSFMIHDSWFMGRSLCAGHKRCTWIVTGTCVRTNASTLWRKTQWWWNEPKIKTLNCWPSPHRWISGTSVALIVRSECDSDCHVFFGQSTCAESIGAEHRSEDKKRLVTPQELFLSLGLPSFGPVCGKVAQNWACHMGLCCLMIEC